MTARISERMTYDADPDLVFAMYADPAFVRHKNEKTGGFDVVVEVEAIAGGAIITASRKLPARLPPYAKGFTGDNISLTETDEWGAASQGEAREASVVLEFHGLPMQAGGRFRLEPADIGSICHIEIEMKVSLPFVGGKVEQVAAEFFGKAIRAEERIGRDWLASH